MKIFEKKRPDKVQINSVKVQINSKLLVLKIKPKTNLFVKIFGKCENWQTATKIDK